MCTRFTSCPADIPPSYLRNVKASTSCVALRIIDAFVPPNVPRICFTGRLCQRVTVRRIAAASRHVGYDKTTDPEELRGGEGINEAKAHHAHGTERVNTIPRAHEQDGLLNIPTVHGFLLKSHSICIPDGDAPCPHLPILVNGCAYTTIATPVGQSAGTSPTASPVRPTTGVPRGETTQFPVGIAGPQIGRH
jgi:hypothetical protein